MKRLSQELKLISPALLALLVAYPVTFGAAFGYSVGMRDGLDKGVKGFFAGLGLAVLIAVLVAVLPSKPEVRKPRGRPSRHEPGSPEALEEFRTVAKRMKFAAYLLGVVCFAAVRDSHYLPGILDSGDLECIHRASCIMLISLPVFFFTFAFTEGIFTKRIQSMGNAVSKETGTGHLM